MALNINGYRINIKSESIGEACLGKLSPEDIAAIKDYCGKDNEFEGSSFIDMPFDYNNMGGTYGVSFELSEFEGANFIIENDGNLNEFPYDKGVYLQATTPTEMRVDFKLNIPPEEFDISKLTIRYQEVELPVENSYGDVYGNVLVGIEYDGDDYTSAMLDSILMHNYSYEVVIFEVNDDGDVDEWIKSDKDGVKWWVEC